MDLVRHLRFFVAVAEEGHFGDAAARLDMTQPPVSQGLRRLERELGVPLIRRTSRGAELTDAGRELLPRARLLIDDAARFVGEARRLQARTDALRWGAVAQVGTTTTARVAARLAAATPLQDMTTASATSLVDQVLAGVVDLAIVDIPCVTAGLATGPTVRIPRAVVVPAGHSVVSATQPRLRNLSDLAFCHPARAANPPAYDQLLDAFREQALDPAPLVIASDAETIAAVAAGRAFSLSTDTALPEGLDGVRCVSIAPDVTALRVRVVYRSAAVAESAEIVTSALWRAAR
ncbi:hypothetical protein GCM10009624_13180 [Gordonia sinesedis]